MLSVFKARSQVKRKAGELYGRVVAAARQAAVYRDMGVPDTPEGRFEMVALMLFLGLDWLQTAGEEGDKVQQLTIEQFVTDMDDCMREMGVGDLTVPKKVRRVAAGFYERAGAYRAALTAAPASLLHEALRNYVYAGAGGDADIDKLATYVRSVRAALTALGDAAAVNGELTFPDPEPGTGGNDGRA